MYLRWPVYCHVNRNTFYTHYSKPSAKKVLLTQAISSQPHVFHSVALTRGVPCQGSLRQPVTKPMTSIVIYFPQSCRTQANQHVLATPAFSPLSSLSLPLSFSQFLFQQMGMVVSFVKIHIRPYMDDIFTLIRVSSFVQQWAPFSLSFFGRDSENSCKLLIPSVHFSPFLISLNVLRALNLTRAVAPCMCVCTQWLGSVYIYIYIFFFLRTWWGNNIVYRRFKSEMRIWFSRIDCICDLDFPLRSVMLLYIHMTAS